MRPETLLAAALVGLLAACGTPPMPERGAHSLAAPQSEFAGLEAFIRQEMAATGVPGLSLAIIRDGEIVYHGAFGVREAGTGDPVTTDTLFEAASLSKPVFAYFVMLQAEQGLLDLDRPLHQYWPHPDLAGEVWSRQLTARMVLAHSSGLPNWRSDTGGELRFLFQPGTAYGYSGEAYEYLKDALKHVLDVDDDGLQALFDAQVTEHAGAGFVRFTWDDSIPARKAFGHRHGEPTDNDRHDHNFGASYSLNTTALDYARLLTVLLRPDAARAGAVERLLAIQSAMPAEAGELHRSLGFPVRLTGRGLRYFHSGNNGDFRAYCHFYPESGDGVVMFGNSDGVFASGLASRIVEYLGDEWFYV
ncbi:MAG: serine hydrolase domain-containing protein [Brevundimonas sp.]